MQHKNGSNLLHFQKHRQVLLSIISLFILALTLPSLNAAPVLSADEPPAGLSGSDWHHIQAQIKAHRYHPQATEAGAYRALNQAQGWWIDYQTDGYTELRPVASESPRYHIGFRLQRLGYGASLVPMPAYPQQLKTQQDQLDYHWNDTLIERWTNSEAKLEQWFLLSARPSGAANGQPLQLQLTLQSDLAVRQNGNALHFSDESGISIQYDRLKVWDAEGHLQTAWLQLDGQQLSLFIDEQHARYPLTIDPSLQQDAYLKASNNTDQVGVDDFGYSVSIDGDTLVVGAPFEDSNATGVNGDDSDNSAVGSGAAYVFIRSGGVWSQQAYLKASNTDAGDSFGYTVSLSGDSIVVGARFEDSNATGVNGDGSDNSSASAGAAYVFNRVGGVWSEQAYLKASNTDAIDFFGWSVAISGDSVIVGAMLEGSNATGVNGNESSNALNSAGAAYVFTRSGGVWSQQAYLKASNTGGGDGFGESVTIDGDTAVVGAVGEDSNATGVDGDEGDNSAANAGAAYVFTRSGGVWSQQAYLKASNTEAGDQFGDPVVIDGDSLIVGARLEDSNTTGVDGDQNDNLAADSGAAYVFTRSAGVWSQQAYLKASNTDVDDDFGYAVGIDGDSAIVGARFEDSNATGVDGDQSNNTATESGAAYFFTRSGGEWSQRAYLKASNTNVGDRFGWGVTIADSDSVVVGAITEASTATGVNGDQNNNAQTGVGAVYVSTIITFEVSGTLSGLAASESVVLQNNGGDDLTLTTDGGFSFDTALVDGSDYDVTVLTQPSGQVCTVNNGRGTLNGAEVLDVAVICGDPYTVGGTLSGLAGGQSVVLQNNGGDDLTLTANGGFSFATDLADGSDYEVTVLTQPSGQVCTVSNDSGTMSGADVTDVTVACVDGQTIGGTLSGLAAGRTLVLQNNGGDDLTLTANGGFTFATALLDGSGYGVTVLTQPSRQICTVSNGSGTLSGADITDVTVDCVDETYTVGGALSGLAGGQTVVLQNNGSDDLALTTNGGFIFTTALLNGSDYEVTVLTQPIGQVCTVSNGSGTLRDANATNVAVSCVDNTYTIGGTLSGLAGGQSVVLQNNGGDDLTLTADGGFTFATALVNGSNYEVTVLTQPSGQICSVSNGSGTLNAVNVTDVAVNCVDTHTVGGTLSGLAGGQSVVLQNNGGDDLTLTADGGFTFATALLDGSDYEVTVLTQPSGQICSVSNGSGTLSGADVTDVAVNCVDTHTVGGTLSGLTGGQSIVLQNNGGDDLTLTANGGFTFATALVDGSNYEVTVLTQPIGQVCSVGNGSGTLSGADVTDVTVNCVDALTVGGTLSGLASGQSVVLQNNGGDDLTLTANGGFTFATALLDGSNYEVTVLTQPSGQICTVSNGSGTLSGADVTDVAVNCVDDTYTIGGTLSGLASGQSVVLQSNGGDDLTLTADGGFTFATALVNGSNYEVTVLTQPDGQICTVTNGSGTLSGADVTDVTVSCVDDTYTIGGTLSGLASGQSVVLQNNGGDDLTLNADGGFTFATALVDGSNYEVTVLTQPSGQVCSVSNGSGTLNGADITDVSVICSGTGEPVFTDQFED